MGWVYFKIEKYTLGNGITIIWMVREFIFGKIKDTKENGKQIKWMDLAN